MHPSGQRAVFLDRDGVLNRVAVRDGVSYPPDSPEEVELLPGVCQALDQLRKAGFALIVVTNQPDVARGTQTRERVEEINKRVCNDLPVLEVLTCYHDNGDACSCRKPRPGMLLAAANRWSLDLGKSYMVGDRWSDVAAGQAAGCRSLLIEKSYSGRERCSPEHCAGDLPEAARWIISQLQTEGERR